MPIYELSYRRMEGLRKAKRLRFIPIAQSVIRQFFRKRAHHFAFRVALAPFFVALFILLIPHFFADMLPGLPPQLSRLVHVTPDSAFHYLAKPYFSGLIVLLVAALAGAGAICEDLRTNALEIYFSRPITRVDYVLGKLGGVLGLVMAVSALPLLLLWLIDLALAKESGYLAQQAAFFPRLVLGAVTATLPWALLMLAVSSLARSPRVAIISFAVVLVIGGRVASLLAHTTREHNLGLLDLREVFERVTWLVLGVGSEETSERFRDVMTGLQRAPGFEGGIPQFDLSSRPLPLIDDSAVLATALGVIVLSLLVLRWRVRGIEIVKG